MLHTIAPTNDLSNQISLLKRLTLLEMLLLRTNIKQSLPFGVNDVKNIVQFKNDSLNSYHGK